MRCGIILAAAVTALSATGAHAEEWCGYSAHPHAVVQCGYSSLEGCQNTIGRGAMCFVNPYVAFNSRRAKPSFVGQVSSNRG